MTMGGIAPKVRTGPKAPAQQATLGSFQSVWSGVGPNALG